MFWWKRDQAKADKILPTFQVLRKIISISYDYAFLFPTSKLIEHVLLAEAQHRVHNAPGLRVYER